MDALKEMSSGRWHNGFNGKIGESLESAADLCFLLNSLPPSAKKKRGVTRFAWQYRRRLHYSFPIPMRHR